MFEKEGIKYAIEETIGTECLAMPIEDFHFIDLSDEQQEKAQCFKDGAEFGYNKCNEELSERLENATEIIELMKDLFFACWQEKGLNAIKFEQRVNDFLKGE